MELSLPWCWQGGVGCVPRLELEHISCQALIRCAFIHGCVLTTGHMRGPAWPTWEQRKRGLAWQSIFNLLLEERLCLAAGAGLGWSPLGFSRGLDSSPGATWKICPFVTEPAMVWVGRDIEAHPIPWGHLPLFQAAPSPAQH